MKNKQICPNCGEQLIDVPLYSTLMNPSSRISIMRYPIFDSIYRDGCRYCRSPLHNLNRDKMKKVAAICSVMILVINIVLGILNGVIAALAFFGVIGIAFCIFNYTLAPLILSKMNQNNLVQSYILLDKQYHPHVLLPAIKAKVTEYKDHKSEYVSGNIMELKSNNNTCYLIYKRAIDDITCEFSYIPQQKELLKDMLKVKEEFLLSNGIEKIGCLQILEIYHW